MRYPEITPNFLPADTPIKATRGKKIAEIKDFWQWAYSNLIDNTVRGKLAEFLVACALGIEKAITQPWAEFDLLSNEGVSIEVKTSGYIQAWARMNYPDYPLAYLKHMVGTDKPENTVKRRNGKRMYMCFVYTTIQCRKH